uniref:Uncharacterized protein n=1 Tax=candidate division WOR-3 bacterium TaxID=2052148 RepID=A0A7C4CBV1_UNCW3
MVLGQVAQCSSEVRTVSLPLMPTDEWHAVGTDTAPYWTGTCTRDEVNNLHGKSDNVIKVEHIVRLGTPPAETTRCGWMKFNTTSIPDGATIRAARIRCLVFYWEMSFDFQFTAVNSDPVSTGARDLYQAIADGTACADRPMGRLWDTTELNTAGVAHIQNSLSRNWVAFGLRGYGWSRILTERAWIAGWNNNPRADSPWLDVDYSVTALSEPGSGSHPSVLSAPTVVKGAFVLPASSVVTSRQSSCSLLDASGRCVAELKVGANDVRHLAPGVYFVRGRPMSSGEQPDIRRVVVIR